MGKVFFGLPPFFPLRRDDFFFFSDFTKPPSFPRACALGFLFFIFFYVLCVAVVSDLVFCVPSLFCFVLVVECLGEM